MQLATLAIGIGKQLSGRRLRLLGASGWLRLPFSSTALLPSSFLARLVLVLSFALLLLSKMIMTFKNHVKKTHTKKNV